MAPNTGADLARKDESWLVQHFGSWGGYLFWAARRIDHRPVNANAVRKSVEAESTYFDDKRSAAKLHDALEEIINVVLDRIERSQAQSIGAKGALLGFPDNNALPDRGASVNGSSGYGATWPCVA